MLELDLDFAFKCVIDCSFLIFGDLFFLACVSVCGCQGAVGGSDLNGSCWSCLSEAEVEEIRCRRGKLSTHDCCLEYLSMRLPLF